MRARLDTDWGPRNCGSVILLQDDGQWLAKVAFLAINPQLLSMREYYTEMRKLAEVLVSEINKEPI